MLILSKIIADIIKETPFLEEGLSLGIINLSSLSRKLQPEIENKLSKDVQAGAIIMALKRLEGKLQSHPIPQISLNDLTVRSNLVEFTFANSSALIEKQRQVLELATKEKKSFLTFTHGVFETTLIISNTLEKESEKIFQGETLISKFTSLSAVTIVLSKEIVKQSGVYYQILKRLAWEGINIVEVISSMTELTIILDQTNVDKAFSVLKK